MQDNSMEKKGNTTDLAQITSKADLLEKVLRQSQIQGGPDTESFKVYYISDIHLERQIINPNNWKNECQRIVRGLFDEKKIEQAEMTRKIIFLFAGDIADSPEMVEYFFRSVYLCVNYYYYKNHKTYYRDNKMKRNWRYKNQSFDELQITANRKIAIVRSLEKEMGRQIFRYYQNRSPEDALRSISHNKKFPKYAGQKVAAAIKSYAALRYYHDWHGNGLDEPSFTYSFRSLFNVFYVLGNHEYIEFDDVKSAVDYYKKTLSKYGVFLLHNSHGFCHANRFCHSPIKLCVYGGTGFAKYNMVFNADSIVGPKNMSRSDECKESDEFNRGYEEALKKAFDENVPLAVFCHYQIQDWRTPNADSHQTTFFCGHNHTNSFYRLGSDIVYADNQIGQHAETISFKSANVCAIKNPYAELEDVCQETSLETYEQFNHFCGSYAGLGRLKRYLNDNENAKLYVIKKSGFYGFFIINPGADTKICNGGQIKNISKVSNINYFFLTFSNVVESYLAGISEFRDYQDRISKQVQALGLDGKIHGCIIDIDFYNHIMVNPFDASLTFYYSPLYGMVRTYDSLKSLLISSENNTNQHLQKAYHKLLDGSNFFLSLNGENGKAIDKSSENGFISVDLKDGLYAVSRKISKWEHLFTDNVLRDWDESFARQSSAEYQQYIPKETAKKKRRIISDEEADSILLDRLESIIKEIKEKDAIHWFLEERVSTEVFCAIVRLFIKEVSERNIKISSAFSLVFAWHRGWRSSQEMYVKCNVDDVDSVMKQVLIPKSLSYKSACLFSDGRDISIWFVGTTPSFNTQGTWEYHNHELKYISDSLSLEKPNDNDV